MSPRRISPAFLALLVSLCSLAAVGPALAQTDDGEGADCTDVSCFAAPQIDTTHSIVTPELSAVLRRGVPFLCGYPAQRDENVHGQVTMEPEADCRIDVKITVPAKVAHYLGLSSRVLADGVAGHRTDHYVMDRDDLGRAYFLKLKDGVKARLKARHIRALGVLAAGKITVVGHDQILCGDSKTPTASCTTDYGKKANTFGAADGEMVCWPVMPWWVAIKSTWGKMCPRPITA